MLIDDGVEDVIRFCNVGDISGLVGLIGVLFIGCVCLKMYM